MAWGTDGHEAIVRLAWRRLTDPCLRGLVDARLGTVVVESMSPDRWKATDFDAEQDAAISALDDKQGELADRERAILVRESKCEAKESDLIRRNSVTEKAESAIRSKEQQLQTKEQKLRAALDGG